MVEVVSETDSALGSAEDSLKLPIGGQWFNRSSLQYSHGKKSPFSALVSRLVFGLVVTFLF